MARHHREGERAVTARKAGEEALHAIAEAAYYFYYGSDHVPGKRTPDRDDEMAALARFIAGRVAPIHFARLAIERGALEELKYTTYPPPYPVYRVVEP
jgi:hypothetical protein